jgi:hypothetical protein
VFSLLHNRSLFNVLHAQEYQTPSLRRYVHSLPVLMSFY